MILSSPVVHSKIVMPIYGIKQFNQLIFSIYGGIFSGLLSGLLVDYLWTDSGLLGWASVHNSSPLKYPPDIEIMIDSETKNPYMGVC